MSLGVILTLAIIYYFHKQAMAEKKEEERRKIRQWQADKGLPITG